MALPTSKPENWAFLQKSTKAAEETHVPDFTGRKTGWLRKVKNDSAKGKWWCDNNWRFFTVDFDGQMVFYSNSEKSNKNVSAPIAFSDIVDVKLLEHNLKRGIADRLNVDNGDNGLCLITSEREIRLLCKTEDDAKRWLSIFASAKKQTKAPLVKALSEASSSISTSSGSDESVPQLSETDSDGSSGGKRSSGDGSSVGDDGTRAKNRSMSTIARQTKISESEEKHPMSTSTTPHWAQPTPEPGSKAEAFFEPDGNDAFAALDALVDEMYVPEPDQSKVDFATAIKVAKAKRSQKVEEVVTPSQERGSAQVQQPVVDKRVAPKDMTEEDRTANDIALLRRQQMLPRSRKATAGDTTSFKATRPLNRPSALEDLQSIEQARMQSFSDQTVVSESSKTLPVAKTQASQASEEGKDIPDSAANDDDPWDSDGNKPSAPKSFCAVSGPSEGVVDKKSWDDDDDNLLKKSQKKKKSKSKRKQEAAEDDPTVGLDDLVDGVLTGKPVSLRVHEVVEGFQCMQCDFKVICFNDFEWAPEMDYLYVRNYYGKPKKLTRMLNANPGISAYCCQCTFKSAASLTDLPSEGGGWKFLSS